MNKHTFISSIKKPTSLNKEELSNFEKLVSDFEYCQLGHQLLSKIHSDSETSLSSEKIKTASIYSTNRQKLRSLIRSKKKNKIQPEIEKKEVKLKDEPLKIEEKVDQIMSSPTKKVDSEKLISTKKDIEKVVQEEKPSPFSSKVEVPEKKKEVKKTDFIKTEISVPLKKNEPIIDKNLLEVKNLITEIQQPKTVVEVKKENKEERVVSPLNFQVPSNSEYLLSEESNLKLDNLLPKETKKTFNPYLIPDELGISYGIGESTLGEAIYSSKHLEENNMLELVFTNKIIDQELFSEENIIDNFLKVNPRINIKNIEKDEPQKNLISTKKGKNKVITETMANILLLQGKNEEAIDIFKKLMVKYPEKKAYFAKKLRELENLR